MLKINNCYFLALSQDTEKKHVHQQ